MKIERLPISGQMKWVIIQDGQVAFYADTYKKLIEGAVLARFSPVDAAREAVSVVREHYNFEHLGRVLAERTRLHLGG